MRKIIFMNIFYLYGIIPFFRRFRADFIITLRWIFVHRFVLPINDEKNFVSLKKTNAGILLLFIMS